MHVLVRPELAELQTVRRSVRLTVVGAIWLGELLPHGFGKGHGQKPEPGSQTITPTLDSHMQTHIAGTDGEMK